MEWECGFFRRTVVLPTGFNEDNVKAETKNGLPTVRLEKKKTPKEKRLPCSTPLEQGVASLGGGLWGDWLGVR